MARKTSNDIVLRSEQETALTYSALDGNFSALRQALDDIDSLSTVAFSGKYSELSELPDLSVFASSEDMASLSDVVDALHQVNVARIEVLESELSSANERILELQSKHPEIEVPSPTLTITPSVTTVIEADESGLQVVTFAITSSDTYSSEVLSWNISGTNINPADFSSITVDDVEVDFETLSGTIDNPTLTHTISVTIARDETSEAGNEIFTLTVSHTRSGDTISEQRSVTINDTSLDSDIRSVTWAGPAPAGPPSLFEYLQSSTGVNMWIENFDISELKLTQSEQSQIIEDSKSEDYTSLIDLGLTISDINLIIENTVPVLASTMNNVVDSLFGSGTVVISDNDVYHLGTYNEDTLELVSANRKYVRNENPTFTEVVYGETYVIADLQAEVEAEVDDFLDAYDWAGNGYSIPTPEQLQTIKNAIVAFTDVIIPIAVNMAEAMTTTVDLYGYRKLTPNT